MLLDRYDKLLNFYRKVGFDHEARWVAGRLKELPARQASHLESPKNKGE
jgi:hypothetical protein